MTLRLRILCLGLLNLVCPVWSVDYIGSPGDGKCVCYDYRTLAAFGGGQVQNCQRPLGRITALKTFSEQDRDYTNSLGQKTFLCGQDPYPEYQHLCCDTCDLSGCKKVNSAPNVGYVDPVRFPQDWAAFNKEHPADMAHNFRNEPIPSASATTSSRPIQSSTDPSTAKQETAPAVSHAPAQANAATQSAPAENEPTFERTSAKGQSEVQASKSRPHSQANTDNITSDTGEAQPTKTKDRRPTTTASASQEGNVEKSSKSKTKPTDDISSHPTTTSDAESKTTSSRKPQKTEGATTTVRPTPSKMETTSDASETTSIGTAGFKSIASDHKSSSTVKEKAPTSASALGSKSTSTSSRTSEGFPPPLVTVVTASGTTETYSVVTGATMIVPLIDSMSTDSETGSSSDSPSATSTGENSPDAGEDIGSGSENPEFASGASRHSWAGLYLGIKIGIILLLLSHGWT